MKIGHGPSRFMRSGGRRPSSFPLGTGKDPGPEERTLESLTEGSKTKGEKGEEVEGGIIRLSRDFGILSRETSFVAIEKRAGDQKTRGEVILRKVPVMLTRGWGG